MTVSTKNCPHVLAGNCIFSCNAGRFLGGLLLADHLVTMGVFSLGDTMYGRVSCTMEAPGGGGTSRKMGLKGFREKLIW